MDTREILKKVRMVELRTRGLVNQVFSGEYHSVFKGRGIDFAEVREYQYGDDVRNIDWKVSARLNRPYMKIFEEERELTVMLIVDFSRSGEFGTARQLKNEIATEVCALLAFSAIRNNDKVGLLLFTDRVERFVPPRKGRAHILRIIRELVSFEPEGKGTDIRGALEYFHHVINKRCIAFLISDFLDSGFDKVIGTLSRKHDLIAVEVIDPREVELPKVGLIKLCDVETGAVRWVDTGSETVRNEFKSYWEMQRTTRSRLFKRNRIDSITIHVDEPYMKPVISFFKVRERRLA